MKAAKKTSRMVTTRRMRKKILTRYLLIEMKLFKMMFRMLNRRLMRTSRRRMMIRRTLKRRSLRNKTRRCLSKTDSKTREIEICPMITKRRRMIKRTISLTLEEIKIKTSLRTTRSNPKKTKTTSNPTSKNKTKVTT